MKTIKILMFTVATLLSVSLFGQESTKQKTEKPTYSCPMKCEKEKTYKKAGKCPVCRMALKEKKTIAFACPMKCEGEKTYYKESKCPQCGMKLKEVNFSNSTH